MNYTDYLTLLRKGAYIAIKVLCENNICDMEKLVTWDKSIKYIINCKIEEWLKEVGIK